MDHAQIAHLHLGRLPLCVRRASDFAAPGPQGASRHKQGSLIKRGPDRSFPEIVPAAMAATSGLPVQPRDPAGRDLCPPGAASLPKLRLSRPAVPLTVAPPSPLQDDASNSLSDLERAALSIGLVDAQAHRRSKPRTVYRWFRHLGMAAGRPLANEQLEALRLFAFAHGDGPRGPIRPASGLDDHLLQQASAYCARKLRYMEPADAAGLGSPAALARDIPGWVLVLVMIIGLFLAAL